MSIKKEPLSIDSIPTLGLALSVGVKAGRLVQVSGMAPLDGDGNLVGVGDIEAQTEQVMKNIGLVLEKGGATFADVIKTTVYLTDARHFEKMNAIYARYFGDEPPARATVQVGMMHPDLMIEIEALALLPESE